MRPDYHDRTARNTTIPRNCMSSLCIRGGWRSAWLQGDSRRVMAGALAQSEAATFADALDSSSAIARLWASSIASREAVELGSPSFPWLPLGFLITPSL